MLFQDSRRGENRGGCVMQGRMKMERELSADGGS
jgi:hypothetical protein